MKRQIARLISILLITAMTATFLPSEYYAATLREKMIVSSVYNIPIEVLTTRPAEEIDELFDNLIVSFCEENKLMYDLDEINLYLEKLKLGYTQLKLFN